jgi:glycosyltransferase involved in cell wall biosynthesis
MRIVHVTDCYLPRLGGIELNVHDLAEQQAAAGHDVVVITSTLASDPDTPLAGGTVIRVAGGSATKPGRIGYHRSWFGRHSLRGQCFDVVHIHASSFSPLSFVTAHYATRQGVPTVATVHSLWAKATPLFQIADRITGWAEWPVEWSAVSNAAAVALRRVLAGRAPVTVLPNGIDPRAWTVTPVAADRNHLRVVVVGRLAARKRTMHLARILLAARHRLPPGTLLGVEIIGDGPERGPLERFLRHHSMTDWVHLRGRLDRQEIRAVLARSDLFLAPALLESFGIAALEARCSGLPILARAGTGTQDFVRHEIEGWLADSDAAMADLIVSLAADRNRLDQVGAHNRSVAPAITWPLVLDRCDTLYQRAALRRKGLRAVRRPSGLSGMDVAAG